MAHCPWQGGFCSSSMDSEELSVSSWNSTLGSGARTRRNHVIVCIVRETELLQLLNAGAPCRGTRDLRQHQGGQLLLLLILDRQRKKLGSSEPKATQTWVRGADCVPPAGTLADQGWGLGVCLCCAVSR